jgi:hypothetical protein
MGFVSLALAGASLVVVYLTRRSKDRAIVVLAWCLLGSLIASLAVHALYHSTQRSTPLMLLDGVALYVTGLMAICRFDGPKWLYVLCGALALQCMAHLAYVSGAMSNNAYVLTLNLLFGLELTTLLVGARKTKARPSAVSWRRLDGVQSPATPIVLGVNPA